MSEMPCAVPNPLIHGPLKARSPTTGSRDSSYTASPIVTSEYCLLCDVVEAYFILGWCTYRHVRKDIGQHVEQNPYYERRLFSSDTNQRTGRYDARQHSDRFLCRRRAACCKPEDRSACLNVINERPPHYHLVSRVPWSGPSGTAGHPHQRLT